jgi:flagellar biosynthesis/type III secretory pathway M-ring protein FliF/YscJ
MKYGTVLIVIAMVNLITIFSGLPTGWKKVLIILTTLCLVAMGIMLRAVAKTRAERIRKQAEQVEKMSSQDLQEITQEIVNDVTEHVEEEIDRIG